MREPARQFPKISEPLAVRSARIWHCKYTSLADLATLADLEVLVIATFPDTTFASLGELQKLKHLSVLHFPKVSDLTPLQSLHQLETLSLASLPSWDASGKVIAVDSLEPIAALTSLRHLELFGVRPHDRSLFPLVGLSLRSARFSKYPKSELQAFYERTGTSDAFAPQPVFRIPNRTLPE